MQKGQTALFLLVGLLLILIVGIGAYYFGRFQASKPQPQDSIIISSPQPTSSPIADKTANWKTYINKLFGYEVKHPKDWYLAGPYGGQAGYDCLSDPENVAIIEFSKAELKECGFVAEQIPPQEADITIWVRQQEIAEAEFKMYKEQASIAGIKARKYIFTEKSELPNVQATRIAFNFNGRGYLIYLKQSDKKGSYDPIYNEILSSFKLLEDQGETNYTCPQNGWVECMPVLTPEGQKQCSEQALNWRKLNCPNFKGAAY